MDSIKSKQPDSGTTIFTVMSALANEVGAINLSQGFPDFEVSPKLIGLVNEGMTEGLNQYAPMAGLPSLRKVLSEKLRASYDMNYDPDTEITVTAGATQAIFTAITAVVCPGDEVILFDPSYDCYAPSVIYYGGIPVHLNLHGETFSIDWDEVREAVNPRTKMIIINTPHNPTGAVLTEEDMKELSEITSDTGIVILSDEVYEHIIFDGVEHQGIPKYPDLASRSFVVYSFGKTFHATGWKVGYCVAPEQLMIEFRKAHQYIVFTVNTAVQYGLANYLQDTLTYSQLGDFYQEKRDLFSGLMKDSGFRLLPSSGSYFILADFSQLSKERDSEFVIRLTREHGVAAIPVSVFCKKPEHYNLVRFCFAKRDATLKKAAEKLCDVR